MESNDTLELFGKEFIEKVRDQSIRTYYKICDGKIKSDSAKKTHEIIASFSNEQVEAINKIVAYFIDEVVFNSLWMFEDSGQFAITKKELIQKENDIALISDGLTGELYSEDGWIQKYSKFPDSK